MNWSAAVVAEVPPAVVTVTSTVPVPAGEIAVSCVSELTATVVAAAAPKVTAVAPERPVPMMITDVPPPAGPSVGLIDVTVGLATTVKGVGVVAVVPVSDEGPVADTWPVVYEYVPGAVARMATTSAQLAFAFSVALALKVLPDIVIRQVLPTVPTRAKPVGKVVWETDTPVIVKLFGLLTVMVSVEVAPEAIEVGAKEAEIVGGTSAFAGKIEPNSRSKANVIRRLTYAHL